ncbi:MAG: hypothetical protein ACMUIL_00060 [bacterium]
MKTHQNRRNLTDTIKHITMRLAEMERSNPTRLMKVKDIMRAHLRSLFIK